jgi:hypothetical protein
MKLAENILNLSYKHINDRYVKKSPLKEGTKSINILEQYDYKTFLKDKYLDWAKKAENSITQGENSKQIYNVDFNDTKSHLKSILRRGGESSIEAIALKYKLSNEQKRSLSQAFSSFIFDDFKKIEKETKDNNDQYVQELRNTFFLPLKALYDRLLNLKPFIVKGRKPNPDAKPAYKPPISSLSSLAEVTKVYNQLVAKMHPQVVQNIINTDMERATSFEKALPNLKIREFTQSVDYKLLDRHFIRSGNNYNDYKLKPSSERQLASKKYAEEQSKLIEDQFVSKNLAKVTSLIGEKGNLKATKAEDIRTTSGVLSGDISFEFADGSGFTIRNQLVSVWAYNKKPHYRFPSTFHDIILPDGTKHKMKSEEWMNTNWLKNIK